MARASSARRICALVSPFLSTHSACQPQDARRFHVFRSVVKEEDSRRLDPGPPFGLAVDRSIRLDQPELVAAVASLQPVKRRETRRAMVHPHLGPVALVGIGQAGRQQPGRSRSGSGPALPSRGTRRAARRRGCGQSPPAGKARRLPPPWRGRSPPRRALRAGAGRRLPGSGPEKPWIPPPGKRGGGRPARFGPAFTRADDDPAEVKADQTNGRWAHAAECNMSLRRGGAGEEGRRGERARGPLCLSASAVLFRVALGSRRDVLVQAEQVRRVVLALERRPGGVVAP